MSKFIVLVCTGHKENGLANVAELQAILERLRPEVIFLEISSVEFDDYLNGTRSTPEYAAASRYSTIHSVKLVPVDLHTPGEELLRRFRNTEYLFDRIADASPEVCEQHYRHSQYASAYGFPYLTSADSSTLLSEIKKLERTTVEELGDPRLVEFYEQWTQAHALREMAMMKNIRKYCGDNSFERGVFLVGAAHRQSIIEISKAQSGDDPTGIRWDFELAARIHAQ